MEMTDYKLNDFLTKHHLPSSYTRTVENWFARLASQLIMHHNGAKRPLIVGINGAQGSGKSTLANLLVYLYQQQGMKAIALSLDDFYFTREQRHQLASSIHPLLITRGVPGTHDIQLACDTLAKLSQFEKTVAIPRFNKALDDRYPQAEWSQVTEPVDVIILEGWCLGSEAEYPTALLSPCNDLEQNEDKDGHWRQYVNQVLAEDYPALFSMVDRWVMLKAPSFDCVFNWRLEQEHKLRRRNSSAEAKSQIMDDATLERFIKHYQRITEHTLKTLPAKVDYLFELDNERRILRCVEHKADTLHNTDAPSLLIFTDMDGSLLDHYSYRHDAADSLLKDLESNAIPVIPVTSKTQSELELLRYDLANQHPFIVENGAAVFIPVGYFATQPEGTEQVGAYWVKSFVEPRAHWQQLIDQVRAHYSDQFVTFADAGIDGIIAMTGLNVHAAARAAQRHYGEPVQWLGRDTTKQAFINELTEFGANILQGGRFIHVSGNCDKGQALQWLTQQYQQQYANTDIQTVAIGDGQNDQAMLDCADYALLIRSPVHDLPVVTRDKNTFISEHTGPRGWAQGVSQIVEHIVHSQHEHPKRENHG
jgi:D-glycerate 3-kinase